MYVICELEVVPLLQQEYEKGYHTLIQAPTGVRRACVVCGTRTRTFCYGCIGAAGTWPHCCSPARNKGRDCFAKLHRLRRPDYQGNERVYAKRRRASDVTEMMLREIKGGENVSKTQKNQWEMDQISHGAVKRAVAWILITFHRHFIELINL